jgi:hypothetical protein
VQSANTSAEEGTYVYYQYGASTSFNPATRAGVTGLPNETSKLDSDLDDIFSRLHELDVSILNANNDIDELKESTRSLITRMLGKA